MKEKSEILCPKLTNKEFAALFRGRWKRAPHARETAINYTFDLSFIPAALERRAHKEHPNLTMEPLTLSTQKRVRVALGLWRVACGETIEFNYQNTLSTSQPGIIFALCKQFRHQGEAWNHYENGGYQYSLICLSYDAANNPYKNTIPHEIGHALGIAHPHEVESVKQQLLMIAQGRGCTVMGYQWLLASPENFCSSNKYCPYGEGHAFVPGPLDQQICTRIYKFPPFSERILLNGLMTGFLHSAAESAVASFLSHIKLLNLNPEMANAFSLTAFILIRSYSSNAGFSLTNSLALVELTAIIRKETHVDVIHFIKTMSNIIGIMMHFYELYNNQDALVKLIYLSTVLAASCAGAGLGSHIGKTTASLTNAIVDNFSSLFNWAKQVAVSASSIFSPISFFSKKKPTNEMPSEAMEFNPEVKQS